RPASQMRWTDSLISSWTFFSVAVWLLIYKSAYLAAFLVRGPLTFLALAAAVGVSGTTIAAASPSGVTISMTPTVAAWRRATASSTFRDSELRRDERT